MNRELIVAAACIGGAIASTGAAGQASITPTGVDGSVLTRLQLAALEATPGLPTRVCSKKPFVRHDTQTINRHGR